VPASVRDLGRAEAPTLLKDLDVIPWKLPNHLSPPGITNHDEYSLVRELMEEKKDEGTGTLRKDKTLLRDEKKMEKLKQKLHTDDECKQN
jgi:talin